MSQTENTSGEVLSLNGRRKLTANGIVSVISYDSQTILLEMKDSQLLIRGETLHIDSFDNETGAISLDGRVDLIEYVRQKRNESLFSRLLR